MNDAFETCKILIVDDSDFSRKAISQLLEDQPYKIVGEASSGKEAIQILKDSKIDIVILDIVMPEMSGLDLAEFIKHNFRETQIILISSLAQENIIIDAISSGANDFLQKPLQKDVLINAIEKIIQTIESKEIKK